MFNLLSSVVLYNTVHVVDRNAIEQLSIALDAASLLSYQAAPAAAAATSGANPYGAIGAKQGQGQGPGSTEMVVRSAEGGGGGGGGGSQPGEEHGVVALDYKSEEPALMSRPHLMWVLQVRPICSVNNYLLKMVFFLYFIKFLQIQHLVYSFIV